MAELFEVLGLLLVFGIILLLCYFTTRFLGKKSLGRAKNKHMRVLETLSLGIDKSLYLILIEKKHFLFLSNKKGLEIVSEVTIDNQIEDSETENENAASVFEFSRIFEKYSGLSNKQKEEQASEIEEAGTGITGSIKKLKGMNSSIR